MLFLGIVYDYAKLVEILAIPCGRHCGRVAVKSETICDWFSDANRITNLCVGCTRKIVTAIGSESPNCLSCF